MSFRGDRPLPIVAVDDPIYRRIPCFLIATVDKFAGLPWEGRVGMLFGKAERYDGEGFYGPCDPGPGPSCERRARGFTAVQAGVLLRAVADERADGQAAGDRVRLVWTGPETHSSTTRDTFVVMQELFHCAQQSVLISRFAVHRGRVVLGPLGRRMETRPALSVRLFLNIHRPYRSTPSEAVLLREFRDKFVGKDWGSPIARGLLRPSRFGGRARRASVAAREVRGGRRPRRVRHVRQSHRGGPAAEHRGGRPRRGRRLRPFPQVPVRRAWTPVRSAGSRSDGLPATSIPC